MTRPPESTIAWSAYNALAVLRTGPTAPAVLLAMLQQSWDPSLTLQEVRLACRQLAAAGIAVLLPGPSDDAEALVDVRDPERRALVSRDRDDPTGWRGWRIEARRGSVAERIARNPRAGQLLQEVLR